MESQEIVIFSGSSHPELASKIAGSIGLKLGKVILKRFKDGEIWVRYEENIRGKNVFIVQSTHAPAENLLELLILIDAAKRASAKNITAVVPYFGYARQDRKDQPRVSITSKLIADLLETAGANRVLTMDLHAAAIQGFFSIPVDHLYASLVFIKLLKEKKIDNLVIISPDVGSAKMARAYASRLGAGLAISDKRRTEHNIAEIIHIIGDVKDKNCVIIDDIIDTAGTLTSAAKAIINRGAKSVFAIGTHGVLSGPAIERIQNSPIKKLIISDTIPLSEEKKIPEIEVESVANIFGESIKRIYEQKSISSLFDLNVI